MSPKTWRYVATVGTIAIGAATLLGHTLLHLVFQGACLLAIGCLLTGLRRFSPSRREPWFGFAACAAIFFVSYGLRLLLPSMAPKLSGDPTVADFIDCVAFLTAIVSVNRLGQVRDKDRDPTTIIDALILTGGLSSIIWTTVMLPYVQNTQLSSSGRWLGVAMAGLSVWLVFGAVRLIIGPGTKSTTSRLLSLAAFCGMLSQIIGSSGPGALGTVVLMFGALALVYLGCSALHPDMGLMTQPATRGISKMTRKRLTSMTVSVLLAPVILLIKVSAAGGSLLVVSGLVGSWSVVTILVMLRLGGLVQARERVAQTERALSRAAASLVSATDRDQTYESALKAMAELSGETVPGLRTSVALALDDEWQIVGSWGYGADLAQGRRLDSLMMSSILSAADNSPVQMAGTLAVDNPGAGACSMVAAPLIAHAQVRGALLISTAEPLSSLVVDALGSLASDVSLAIEAVGLSEDLHRRRSEHRFRALVENTPDIILVVSADEIVTFASPAADRLLGNNEHTWPAFLQHVHPDDLAIASELVVHDSQVHSRGRSVEFRMLNGKEISWFEATSTDLSHESEISGVVVNARDISERKTAEVERQLRESRFQSLVQNSSDVTIVLNQHGHISYITPAVEHMLGYEPERLIGSRLSDIVHVDDARIIDELAGLLIGGHAVTKHVELRVTGSSGEQKTLDVTLTDLRDDPSVNGIVMNAHDVTDRKALERDLRHKVLHDDLTGIANRVLFRDRVEHSLRSRQGKNGMVTAVLFIDVDDFKTVNDGLGHDMGDEFLKIIAFRLESFVRSGDTAARLGGDEFAVLLEDLYTVEDVLNASQRLLTTLNEPITFEGREITVSVSIGISLAEEGATSEVLLRNADVAMYHAKQTGKNRVKLFDQAMYVSAFERLELKGDLVHALERNELSLFYQPLIKMGTGELIGFEALMRWTHPTRGFVSPASFIPLAEETGLIIPIGAWALQEALSQLATWRASYQCEVGMSVNVSPRQLEDSGIIKCVETAIVTTGVDPSWITLELTESAGLDDATRRDRLIALRSLGCEIAADDFGTGFASYAALQQLPFTNVKIDRSLIIGLSSGDAKAQAQVRSIIQMGHALGLTITAEGIEDSRQADALVVMGADKGQGYLFGRPTPAAEAEEQFRHFVAVG